MATARAYVRVNEPAPTVVAGLPELSGAHGARLVLSGVERPSAGPPAGAVRYRGYWHSGGASGKAELLVMPFAAWGTEVHVTVRAPSSLSGAFLWRQRRLSRIAVTLALGLRDACGRPFVASVRPGARTRWTPVPAIEGSAVR